MTHDYDRDDPSFIEDLRASRESVEKVARWLSRRGHPVVVRPTFERPSAEEMNEYSDSGDLEVLFRVEVKQRKTLTFTSKDDFPYDSLIVDACHCYDRAHPKPFAYVILNREMDAAFLVETRTFPHWTRVEKLDRMKNRTRCFYECPLEYVSFIKIGDMP